MSVRACVRVRMCARVCASECVDTRAREHSIKSHISHPSPVHPKSDLQVPLTKIAPESMGVESGVGEVFRPSVIVARHNVDLLILGRGESHAQRLTPQLHLVWVEGWGKRMGEMLD